MHVTCTHILLQLSAFLIAEVRILYDLRVDVNLNFQKCWYSVSNSTANKIIDANNHLIARRPRVVKVCKNSKHYENIEGVNKYFTSVICGKRFSYRRGTALGCTFS